MRFNSLRPIFTNCLLTYPTCGYYSRQISEKALHKLKLKQAKMQSDDKSPSFLKRGTRDKILFTTTAAIILYNTILCLKQLNRRNET